jgi:hypothetical protein
MMTGNREEGEKKYDVDDDYISTKKESAQWQREMVNGGKSTGEK